MPAENGLVDMMTPVIEEMIVTARAAAGINSTNRWSLLMDMDCQKQSPTLIMAQAVEAAKLKATHKLLS